MKRFIYIIMFFIGLTAVSCAKQDVSPVKNNDTSVAPTWRSADASGVVLLDDEDGEGAVIVDPNDPNNGKTAGENGAGVIGGVITGGEIVDPNDPNNN